ncbi:hypothetical protein [Blastococcus sp. SYSU D01042]
MAALSKGVESSRATSTSWMATLGAVVLIVTPALAKVCFYADYPGSDDAFIHIAVAQHILDGEGWGIDSSDRVNMSSSPVFTVLLLPLLAMGDIGLIQLVTLAFASAALALLYVTARRLSGSTGIALVALAVGAFNVHLWRWSGTVMETSLGFLAVALIVWLTVGSDHRLESDRRLFLAGLAVGLGTLVRFEIGILLVLIVATLFLGGSRVVPRVAIIVAGFAGPVLAWVAFAQAYFGDPVPTTFSAKASSFHLVNVEITRQIVSVVASGYLVSLVAAVGLSVIAIRGGTQPADLAGLRRDGLVLIGWPLALFAFYYLKTDFLQSAARYYLPGMYTWPLVFALLLSLPAVRRAAGSPALIAVGALSLAAALVFNAVQVAPVLQQFNDGYRSTMAEGAAFLRGACRPGDRALISVDIGVMADEGIGNCELLDGGGLATPRLQQMDLDELVEATTPTFVVQSIAEASGDLLTDHPEWRTVLTVEYASHGVSTAGARNFLNIYRTGD